MHRSTLARNLWVFIAGLTVIILTLTVPANAARVELEYVVTNVEISSAREGWVKITVDIFVRNPQQVLAYVPSDLGYLEAKWKEYVYEGSIETRDFRWLPPKYGFATQGKIEVPERLVSELTLQLIPQNGKPLEINLKGPWSPQPLSPLTPENYLKLGETFEYQKEWAITPIDLYTRPYSLLLRLVVANLSGYDKSGTLTCQIMRGDSCWYRNLQIPLVPPFMTKEVTLEIESFKTIAEDLSKTPYLLAPEYHLLIVFPDNEHFVLYVFRPSIEIKPPVLWEFALAKDDHITSFVSLARNIYMGTASGKVYAFDSESGEVKWEKTFPGNVEQLASSGNVLVCWVKKDVYISVNVYDYLMWGVYTVDADTGQVIGQITGRAGFPLAIEFAGVDERAFYLRVEERPEEVPGSYGVRVILKITIQKYDITSFQLIDQMRVEEEVPFGRGVLGARVLVHNGIVYMIDTLSWCSPGYLRIRFLRWPSGEKIWAYNYDEGPYWWKPLPLVVQNGTLYAVTPKQGLIALNSTTGEYKFSIGAYAIQKFVISPERIYIFAPSDARGPCFAIDILENKWNETLAVQHWAKPLGALGGLLFIEKDNKVLAVYENPVTVSIP